MAIPRTQFNTIDDYIASFPKNIQDILEKLRRLIKEYAPTAEETINYGIPTFTLNGNLVHFAAFKNHIGFYPTPSAIAVFKKNYLRSNRQRDLFNFPLKDLFLLI